MKTRTLVVGFLVLLLAAASTAWAKDSISVVASPASGPIPVIVNNGQAVGTIQLFYAVNAYQFTTGPFASFSLNWVDNLGSPATVYPSSGIAFSMVQSQQGGNVSLSPDPATFTLLAAGQSGKSTVNISIVNSPDGTPPPSADNTELVGNLKLDAGSKVGTVTNVQVHIVLQHPTACLKVYNFVTDENFSLGILDSINLTVPKNGANAGKVVSSTPGQVSDNVLIANTCASDQSFDLAIVLDPDFQTNPHDNPGNAVFTYSTSGIVDETSFNISAFGTGTGQHQTLCLQNVTVAANTSFFAAVHAKVMNVTASTLPTVFDFAASLVTENSGCSGQLDTLADPNPAGFSLPYTIKIN